MAYAPGQTSCGALGPYNASVPAPVELSGRFCYIALGEKNRGYSGCVTIRKSTRCSNTGPCIADRCLRITGPVEACARSSHHRVRERDFATFNSLPHSLLLQNAKQTKLISANNAVACSFKRQRRGTPLHVRLSLKWHSLVRPPSLHLPPD